MKHTFKLGAVIVEELGLRVEGIEITTEYSIVEAKGAYSIARQAINELPSIIEDIAESARTVERIEEEFAENQIIKHQKRAAVAKDLFSNLLASLREKADMESEQEEDIQE